MTIAVSLKVNDGVVLAADSATTLSTTDTQTGDQQFLNVYNNANKVFNLVKGLPLGAITWGSGSIGPSSIATIVKDLRRELSDQHNDRWVNPESYTVEEVAQTFRQFVCDDLYMAYWSNVSNKPDLGFIIAGYSSEADLAEEFRIDIKDGTIGGPELVRNPDQTGVSWSGQPWPIGRLMIGCDPRVFDIAEDTLALDPSQKENLAEAVSQQLQAAIVQPAMPIQDAIDLAEFLVYVTAMFSRFSPGIPVVGGPIEIAAVTKHEGFKWISRKHYYSRDLNPEG